MKYCIDTSSFIESWHRRYPQDIFPSFWHKLSDIIDTQIVVAQELVIKEIESQDDTLHEWVKQREKLRVPFDEKIQQIASGILQDYPRIVGSHQKFGADPFVIALAKQRDLTVITEEQGGTDKKPKIPFICRHINVRCVSMLEFIREMKWSF